MPADEILPVVDAHDRILRYLTSGEIHDQELRHREVVIYLFDQNGNVLVQKRDGGVYDHSVAGHVPKGERYIQAACRELQEEVGLTVTSEDLLRVGKFYHRSYSLRSKRFNDRFFMLYILKLPVNPKKLRLDKHEVDSIVSLTLPQIRKLFKGDKTTFKGGFPVSFKRLVTFLKENKRPRNS